MSGMEVCLMAFIYKITNNINEKFYIGFTSQKNVKWRFNQHLSTARSKKKNNQPIIRAIRKYGEENFSFEILLEGGEDFLLKKEEPRLIEELKPEYNATFGGEGILGYRHTEKTKKIISNLHTGRKEGEEHKKWRIEKIKEGWKNVPLDKKINYSKNHLEKNTQRIEIELEGIKFKSMNEAARWAVDKYCIGRNTALRYIKEGRSFSNKKLLNYSYNGTYKATKYL
jgi:group I intron endonuclease